MKLAKAAGRNPRENLTGYLFVLPALAPLVVFWVFPVILSFAISFTDWDLMSESFQMVGLRNYLSLVQAPQFFQVLRNSLVFALGTTIPTLALGLAIALALSGARHGIGVYRAIIFAPYITPMVAVSIVWAWIFEPRVGVLNFLLGLLRLPGLRWTESVGAAMLSVIIVTVWKQLGWTMIFYLEAIKRVPKSLLEAAMIDGAGAARRFLRITVPMISPTTFFLVIITTINSLQAYDQIQVLTQGGPAGATRTLLYYYYQEAFDAFNVGKASAVAVILVIITVALSIAETLASKKAVHYS